MLSQGDTFERYTIEALLGRGGMGAVYRAYDPRLRRRVALKVISDHGAPGTPDSAEADARLKREALAAAALAHPNSVSIFDVGEHDGAPYIVMELVEGHTLRAAIGGSLPLATRLSQLGDVARALADAHRRGLVHRDIKPENVMVRDDGVVKVLDFGIARRSSGAVDPNAQTQPPALPTLTVAGSMLGTPVYMSPEQIRCDPLDGRADQFSWGVVAYELLAGRLPWRGTGDGMAAMASVLTDTPDASPLTSAGVSPAVQEIVLRALQKRPADRFASMDDLLRALDAAIKGDPLPAVKAPARPVGTTEAQQFSTGEIREVLGKAMELEAQKKGSVKLGFEDLLAVAAEVGVDPESLREASRALRAPPAAPAPLAPSPGAELQRRDAWLRQQRLVFFRHAGIHAIVNAGLIVLGLVLHKATPAPLWPFFIPGLAWGVALAIHGLWAMTQNEVDWQEHEEGMRWWRERNQERMARRRRREQWVEALPDVLPEVVERMRVAATGQDREASPSPPARQRRGARVAAVTDTQRERAAEEEAVGEEQVERRQRRR
jgi:serine/threonine-protein kinase